jgi:hypothetical protein
MKVDKNSPLTSEHTPFGCPAPVVRSNMPLRLEIAARILAGFGSQIRFDKMDCEVALASADALIDAHNATAGKEGAE